MSAWGLVLDRQVVLVEGPDAATYLQGQLSQEVAALPVGGSVPSLLLTPQGHLVSFLRIGRAGEEAFALDVDGAVQRVTGGWTATGQAWAYDADRYARVSADRAAEQQAMRDYASTPDCRMLFLRRQLDDPDVVRWVGGDKFTWTPR